MQITIVILAGGEGSRMGGGKPLRRFAGETLIERALRTAAGWSDDVRVAVRDPVQVGSLHVPLLLDDPELWGPLAGLASALAAAREAGRSHVLTIPCDMPLVPADLLERFVGAIGGREAALAASGGQLHPVCGLWSVRVLERLPAYRAAGRRSLKGLAETVGAAVVEWPDEAFANVNTPEELAEAERRLASEVEHVDQGS